MFSSLYNLGNEDIYPLTYECGPGKSLTAILHKVFLLIEYFFYILSDFLKITLKNIIFLLNKVYKATYGM